MAQGTVVGFKDDKGFGFIRPDGGGGDVFVHARDITNRDKLAHGRRRDRQGLGLSAVKRVIGLIVAGWLRLLPASAFAFGYGFEGGSGGYNSAAVGGGTSFGISFISDNSGTTAGATFTFTSQAIGTADPTRIVAVGITHGPNGVTISSVTIGGISATQAPGAAQAAPGGSSSSDIWYAAVPTGTTATIVINYSASETRMALVVYSIVGTGAAFSTAGGATGSVSVTSLTTTISTPVGGGAIAVVLAHNIAAQTFSGTNLTVDIPSGIVAGSSQNSSGHDTTHSGSTAYTMTWTTGVSDAAMSMATFSP